jgi:cell division transport system ATP-binding protein
MIRFENVTKIYSGSEPINALKDVSFEINEKEFVSITGKSGAGKTTILKLLLVEEKPSRGKIFFEGKDIHHGKNLGLHHLRRKMGVIFQDYKLLPNKNIFENVAYPLELMGASDDEIFRKVPQLLEIVGLGQRAKSFPKELSAGERQRVAIARALIHRPKVILADEPAGNLDPYNSLEIIKLLLKIHQSGTTVVLASHDKEIINRLGKRVITLDSGRIIRDEEKGHFIL